MKADKMDLPKAEKMADSMVSTKAEMMVV